jgi:biotin transport system substrate-specific component
MGAVLQGSRARDLAIAAVFAALMAVGALFSIPFYPVPLSLQTFFVYLSVLLLRRSAFMSQAIYILMGIAGLPIFSKGMAGYAALLGPTGGFIVGFLLAAVAGGALYGRTAGRRGAAVATVALCILMVFGTGWAWLTYWLGGNFEGAFLTGVLPFLPGDALKAALAIVVAGRLQRQGIGNYNGNSK